MRLLPVLTMVLGVGAWSGEATAAWPDDVTLSELGTWNGTPVDESVIQSAYHQVMHELGVAISNKPVAPAETLGINGFDLGFGTTLAFIDTSGSSSDPSAWARVHGEGDPSSVMAIPWIQARKGLPLSLELGGNVGYIGLSHQTVFGGYGRWGLLEGYHPIPDITMQIGYSGYVGNDELELGVMDTLFTVGYTLPFGTLVGINQAQFSPYLGGGVLAVHAAPLLDEDTLEEYQIAEVSGFQGSTNYDPEFRHPVFHGGFRILSRDFQFRLSASFAPSAITCLNAGLGFVY